MNNLILVTGATGQQGGAVARHLLKQGHGVRALTRNPQKADELKNLGAEVIQGDLSDRASIDNALKDVSKMFLVTTPYENGVDSEMKQGYIGIEAAKDANIEHVVFTSVGSAHRNTGIPHFESKRKIEQRIRELGLNATMLRPVFFMENFGSPWFLPSLQKGAFALPLGADRKLAMISVENIGEFGARALIESEKYSGDGIELAGDELSMKDTISMISKATGKDISYQALPHEGADKIFGQDFALMFKWFDEVGYNPDIPDLVNKYNIPLTNFAEHLKTATWLKDV